MGVIIKYLIDFPVPGFKVSNDLLEGDFVIDVKVTIEMMPGASGTRFTVELIDLPDKKAQALMALVAPPQIAQVNIKLGYFDQPFALAVSGVITKAKVYVEGDTLVTRLEGLENATYALTYSKYKSQGQTDNVSVSDAVKNLLQAAFPDGGGSLINTTPILPTISGTLNAPSLKGKSALEVLEAIATAAQAELVVTDQKVYLGNPVANNDYTPANFSRDTNLAVFRPLTQNLEEDTDSQRLVPVSAAQSQGYIFTIAGDPSLRPGNRVFANVDGPFADATGYGNSNSEFRVLKLVHKLNMTEGYICEGVALKVIATPNGPRQQKLIAPNQAEDVARRLAHRIKAQASVRPVMEVCAVNTYKEGAANANPHRANLLFGQHFDPSETQPSIRAPVDTDPAQLFANKPVVSAFAWHKCGLVTPVYPGMKALVAHNLGLTDDGIIAGFLWSDQPKYDPPQNKPGDWWLCLPVNFDGTTPTDSTNAANDLIANNGHRVIEVSGLRITVGKSTLGTVGARPTESTDDDFLIEHKPSGTTFEIDKDGVVTLTGQSSTTVTIDKNGKVTINASSGVTIKGDLTVNGNVNVQ